MITRLEGPPSHDEIPRQIKEIIVKISQRCNLNCSYCYMYNHADKTYQDRPAFMSNDTFRWLLDRTKQYCQRRPGHKVLFTFHGGEPTLVGPRRFEDYITAAQDALGQDLAGFRIQTNAVLLNDEWVRLFRQYRVRVGVSLDGPPEVHDMFRVDHSNQGSHSKTVQGIRVLQEGGIEPAVNCVVNPALSGKGIYLYFRSLGIKWMDVLLPYASHDSHAHWYGQYKEHACGRYLISVFDEWVSENNPTVNIRLFVNIIKAILGYGSDVEAVGAFGRPGYIVVDSDGSIQANDVLKTCIEGLPDTGLNVRHAGFDDLSSGSPLLFKMFTESVPLCVTCLKCDEVDVCGGGHLAHRYSQAREFSNPSVWCQDLLMLIRHVRRYVSATQEVAV